MGFSYTLVDGLRVYDISDAVCEDLLQQVEAARPNSYPQPNKVAAVVLTARGTTYAGVSYHTGVMSLTMHAEATALAHAAIHGDKELIAITGPNCHACKQLIWESSINAGIDMVVVMRQGSQFLKVPISQMMQFAWPENRWRDTRQ